MSGTNETARERVEQFADFLDERIAAGVEVLLTTKHVKLATDLRELLRAPAYNSGIIDELDPCPLCKQYSHSIGGSKLAAAHMHFESMFSHRGDGIPTQHCFDEQTRDAAQVLVAAAKLATPVSQPAVGEGSILLEMAEASRDQELWERRFYQFCKSYPSWRTADDEGPWGLRDLLTYIAPICGFDASKVREP